MSWLRLEGVSNEVLKDVRLGVGQGEFMVLVGPSGAGKTSLLKVIAGLMPHEGRVWFGHRDVSELPPHRRGVGMVFQQQVLFPHLSVLGNVTLALRAAGVGRRRRKLLAMEMLDMVGIARLAQTSPGQLSGGERQRLALARALASRPRILLLDEPFSSLDPLAAGQLCATVRELHQSLGLTTILVTHRMEEALSLGDVAGVVQEGRVVETGPPERVVLRGLCALVEGLDAL